MSALELAPAAASVPMARRFARTALQGSACDVDTVLLLVSEVVTNAVIHARGTIRLTVEDRGDVARVEVSDGSPSDPRIPRFQVASATGRGLRMLDRLARSWGVVHAPGVEGKVVWFEVGVPTEAMWAFFAEDPLREGALGDS